MAKKKGAGKKAKQIIKKTVKVETAATKGRIKPKKPPQKIVKPNKVITKKKPKKVVAKIPAKTTSPKKAIKKKPFAKETIKKTEDIEAFPNFPLEKEKKGFFANFVKKKKTTKKKAEKKEITEKPKAKIKFSIWWLLPPFLRPKHAKVVKITVAEEKAQEIKESVGKPQTAVMDNSKTITTGIDRLLSLIEEKKKITMPEARVRLGLTEEIIEEWVSLLENHKFIVLYYPTMGPAELMSLDYSKNHKLEQNSPIKEIVKEEPKPVKALKEKKKFNLSFRRKKHE